jgi:hypothetical protein
MIESRQRQLSRGVTFRNTSNLTGASEDEDSTGQFVAPTQGQGGLGAPQKQRLLQNRSVSGLQVVNQGTFNESANQKTEKSTARRKPQRLPFREFMRRLSQSAMEYGVYEFQNFMAIMQTS